MSPVEKAQDGNYRMTDVCDIEEMFRIIESIPSKNAEPIKQWLAKLYRKYSDCCLTVIGIFRYSTLLLVATKLNPILN